MSWNDGMIPFPCAPCFARAEGRFVPGNLDACLHCKYRAHLFPQVSPDEPHPDLALARICQAQPQPNWQHCEQTLQFKRMFAFLAENLCASLYDETIGHIPSARPRY